MCLHLQPCQDLTPPPGISLRPGKAPLRSQAVGLRRSDKTSVPQEGQDHKEGCAPVRMHTMQVQGAAGVEALQALRVGVCRIHDLLVRKDANMPCSGDKKTKGAALVF